MNARIKNMIRDNRTVRVERSEAKLCGVETPMPLRLRAFGATLSANGHVQRNLIATLLVSCLLAGCNFAPTYVKPTTDVADTYKEAGPWRDAAPSDQLERGDWWSDYHDATLADLEAKVDTANPDLAVAADRYDQARAYLAQTRSAEFPEIDSAGMATRNRQSDHRALRSASQPTYYGDNIVGAQLSYELDLWGRVRNSVAAGKATTQAAAADFASVRLSLHAELANDYITLRGFDAQEKLFVDTVQAYEEALKLTQSRFEGGIASNLDVSRAQTQLNDARAQLTDVRARRALVEHTIASLIGVSASKFSLPPKVVELPIPTIPVALPSTLLERRPDVAAAERRAAAANSMIGVARAAFFPSISLTATGGYENTGGAGWLTAGNEFWSLGPRFSFALFDAGKRRAISDQAKAVFNETADRYRGTALAAFQQVEDNLALLQLLGEEAKQESAAVASAQNTLHLAMDRYENGAINYLDVVDSQTAALQAQRTLLTLRDRQLRASIDLIRAVGGGWSTRDMPDGSAAKIAKSGVSADNDSK
jgi:NodT family efflux transporter outer membrane factor (OMF) lipoprotein